MPRAPLGLGTALAVLLGTSAGCSGHSTDPRPLGPVPEWAGLSQVGGAATSHSFSDRAFTRSVPGLALEERLLAGRGSGVFLRTWTAAAPVAGREPTGLGPRFAGAACADCHPLNGGGPVAVGPGPEAVVGAIVLFACVRDDGSLAGDPVYGDRLLSRAIEGYEPDGTGLVRASAVEHRTLDGRKVALQRMEVEVTRLSRGPVSARTIVSLRAAPALVGLGLLEAIPASDLVEAAEARRFLDDGVRGRPSWVDPENDGSSRTLGRFGWKAAHPTLRDQIRTALERDMGIATSAQPDITADDLAALVFYMQTLAVPARSVTDLATVSRGAALFQGIGCTACHTPSWTTGEDHPIPSLRNQAIYPFTDLLLHDLGEGLSSPQASTAATPREWRTAPLWGLGIRRRVTHVEQYLHDGRARTPEEAVLWHDGEGKASRLRFERLAPGARGDVLAFLDSL